MKGTSFGEGKLYIRNSETGRMKLVGKAEDINIIKPFQPFPKEVQDRVVKDVYGKSIVHGLTGVTHSFSATLTIGEPIRMDSYSLIPGVVPFQVICTGDRISIILSDELVLSIDNPIMVEATLRRSTDWGNLLLGRHDLENRIAIAQEISLTLCLRGTDISLVKGEEPGKLIVPQLIKSISVSEMLDIINDRIVDRRKKKR